MTKAIIGYFFTFLFVVTAVSVMNAAKDVGPALPSLFIAVITGYYSRKSHKNYQARVKAKELQENNEKIKKDLLVGMKNKDIKFKYLGGYGYELNKMEIYSFGVMEDGLKIISEDNEVLDIAYGNVTNYEVGGTGTTVQNAGVTGGGFGVEGFIKGAVTAAVINAATTKSTTNTLLKITTNKGELFMHTDMCEPDELRMQLSPLSVKMSKRNDKPHLSIADELTKLNNLMQEGVISEDDFKNAKMKLLNQ